jgi:hypothetical protein
MKLDRDAVLTQLRARNVDLQAFATDPKSFERAVRMIYKAIPWPWRWVVRKKRVRYVAGLARDMYLKATPLVSAPVTTPGQMVGQPATGVPRDQLRGDELVTRTRIENETLMQVYQPALTASLDAIGDQPIRFDGFANIGNCESYYLITTQGIHYCELERAGALKKQYVPRFFDLEPVEKLDVESRGPNTYLRFMGGGKMLLVMWFNDETSMAFRNMPAEREAMAFAEAYGES